MDLFGDNIPPPSSEDDVSSKSTKDSALNLQSTARSADSFVTIDQADDPQFEHPKYATHCVGHDDVQAQIAVQLHSGKPPHAIILTGEKGIGKATLAYTIVKHLLAKNAPDMLGEHTVGAGQYFPFSEDDTDVRKVISGGHPDFLAVERAFDTTKNKYKASVAVDDIRKIPSFLSMTSAFAGWRAVIVDDADTMTRSSQNAILKILEEPPKNTLLILVVHRLGALVPTILSRCQVVKMNPLNADEMDQLLKAYDPMMAAEERRILKQISHGCFGRAFELIREGGLEALKTIGEAIAPCPHWQWDNVHKLADDLAKPAQAQSYKNFTRILLWAVETITKTKARQSGYDAVPHEFLPLMTYYDPFNLPALLDICAALRDHFDQIDRANLDKRQSVLGAFSILVGQTP